MSGRIITPDDIEEMEERAVELYEDFHWGDEAGWLRTIKASIPPPIILRLGELDGIYYRSKKAGEKGKYIHMHKRPFPILACDPYGTQLFIIGGNYQIKEEGIID